MPASPQSVVPAGPAPRPVLREVCLVGDAHRRYVHAAPLAEPAPHRPRHKPQPAGAPAGRP